MSYANKTTVGVAASKVHIEQLLTRFGATAVMSGYDRTTAYIAFEIEARHIRITVPLPDADSDEFWTTPSGRAVKSDKVAAERWEQACRSRWRAMHLSLKAKLVAIEEAITTVDDEFLSHMVTPDGSTVGQVLRPQLERSREGGAIPRLMLPGGAG